MTTIRTCIMMMCMAALVGFCFAEDTAPKRISPADAKNHIGENVTVCGKVVDAKNFGKYGIAGHGKPVSLYLDQPEQNPVFYFVTFGTETEEVVSAYQGKNVCVTGKITEKPSRAGTPADSSSSGKFPERPSQPFIMAADRDQIKVLPDAK